MQTKSIKEYTLELLSEAGLKTDYLHNAPQVEIYYQLKEQIRQRFKHEATSEPFFKLIDDLLSAVLKVAMQRHFNDTESKEQGIIYLNGKKIDPQGYINEGSFISFMDKVDTLKWYLYAIDKRLEEINQCHEINTDDLDLFMLLDKCDRVISDLPFAEMELIDEIETALNEA